MLMHATYNDPVGKFDHDLRIFDIDVQIAGLSIPFVLPDDYTLTVGNTSLDHCNFMTITNTYSNTPSAFYLK